METWDILDPWERRRQKMKKTNQEKNFEVLEKLVFSSKIFKHTYTCKILVKYDLQAGLQRIISWSKGRPTILAWLHSHGMCLQGAWRHTLVTTKACCEVTWVAPQLLLSARKWISHSEISINCYVLCVRLWYMYVGENSYTNNGKE